MSSIPPRSDQPTGSHPLDARSEVTRRALLQWTGVGVMGLTAGSLLAACGSSSSSGAGALTGTPVRGGTLNVGMLSGGSIETLTPGLWYGDYATPIRLFQIYDPLYQNDFEGKVAPYVVESAEPNSDATVWTLRLRDGVTFHDGKPATAEDLAWTIKSWADESHVSYSVWQPLFDGKGVRTRDKLSVEMPLLRPVADLPSMMTGAEHCLVQHGSTLSGQDKNPVGTGPFKYESFKPGRSEFSRNENYWQEGRPYVDKIVVDSSFEDERARVNALLSGTVDALVNVPGAQAKANQDAGSMVLLSNPGPNAQIMYMRVTKAPFDDVRVRQAMKLLVDRQAMIDAAISGFGAVGNDLAPAGKPHFAADLKRELDVEQAKSLLKQAGQTDLRVTLSTSNAAPGLLESGTLLQQQARAAGVTVELKRIPQSQFYTSSAGYPYAFGQDYWNGSLTSLTQWYMTTLWSGGAYNESKWGNAQSDRLVFDAVGELDPGKAEEKWRAVQELQFNDGGDLIWASQNFLDAIGTNIGGFADLRSGLYLGPRFTGAWKKA